MACPQKENGYTAIANEIMEALSRYRIPGEQMQCLLCVLRKTYGFNKMSDRISNRQLSEMTGIKRPNVRRAIKCLIEKNVIKKDNRYRPTYRFNKDYQSWKSLSKKIPPLKKDNKSLSKKIPTKVDIKQTLLSEQFSDDSNEYRLSNYLLNHILKRKPDHKQPNLQKWSKTASVMLRRDNRSTETIKDVIRWCQNDEFWQNNILSMDKLRKQFDQLEMKMNSNGNGKPSVAERTTPASMATPETDIFANE